MRIVEMGSLITLFTSLNILVLTAGVSIDTNLFGTRIIKGLVTNPHENHIVGIAASRVMKDVIWMVNSIKGDNYLYALDVNTGAELAWLNVTGAINQDWEDMAYGPCADDCEQKKDCSVGAVSRYCIYIADIGSSSKGNVIYMVREPTDITSVNGAIIEGEAPVVSTVTFTWTETDAETLMIAPDSTLFIVSKIDHGRGMIAKVPDNAWGTIAAINESDTAVVKIYTDHHDPQGGSISPDGKEMILVCEEDVFYYSINNGDYINAVRTQIPERVATYVSEDDTEAITWSADAQGFYTYSKDSKEYIYYYPRSGAIIG